MALLVFCIGGVANVAARGASDLIKSIKVKHEINAIRNNACRIASLSAKKKSLEIWNIIGADNFSRNAFKSWGIDDIFDLLISEASVQIRLNDTNSLLRYVIYSCIISCSLSGWC